MDRAARRLSTSMLVIGLSIALLVAAATIGIVLDPAALARWFAHPALGDGGVAMAVRSAEWTQSVIPGALFLAAGMIIVLWRT
ncbi:MAG: hypothetical protein KGR22_11100, partial [Planctomycetes bacterium]|nr:hypothetical protein [Planctomycetota bacterium]